MTPDPVSTIDHLYSTGAWFCLGIVLLFFGLRWASQHVPWLEEDHRAVYVSALLGGLALLIVPVSQGTTPNLSMWLTVGMTIIALAANPKKPAQPPGDSTPSLPKLGAVLLVACMGSCVWGFGCATLKSESKAGLQSIVDCTKGAAPAAIAQFGPVVDSLLVLATGGDGKIDHALVKDATRSFAIDVGGCVLAKAVAKIAAAPAAGSDAPKSSALVSDTSGLLGELYPGVEFKL